MGKIADGIRTRLSDGWRIGDVIAWVEGYEDQQQLDVGPSDFDLFWSRWPHKVQKPVAQKSYLAARRRGNSHQTIMVGVDRYIREKPADRPWLNPSTFLNQDRFNDQPAPVSNGKGVSLFFEDDHDHAQADYRHDAGRVPRTIEHHRGNGHGLPARR